jgi:hypothetical protein
MYNSSSGRVANTTAAGVVQSEKMRRCEVTAARLAGALDLERP